MSKFKLSIENYIDIRVFVKAEMTENRISS